MPTIRLVSPQGEIVDVDTAAAGSALEQGWRQPTAADEVARVGAQAAEANYGGVGGAAKATLAGVARGVTVGLSDVAARAIGGEDAAIELGGLREAHSGLSIGGELVGAVAPALLTAGASTPASAASLAGRGVARLAGGGLRGAVAGGVVEGAIGGLGAGVSELALSTDPLTMERAASTLSSNLLFGAATGGVAGGIGHGVERGLVRAKQAVDSALEARAARLGRLGEVNGAPGAGVADVDIGSLDRRGLQAARETEVAAIEAERLPLKRQLVEELHDFRDKTWDAGLYKTTSGVADGEIREAGGSLKRADRALRNALDTKEHLARNPQHVLKTLQQQEQALIKIREWGRAQWDEFLERSSTVVADARADILAGKVFGENPRALTPEGIEFAVSREATRRSDSLASEYDVRKLRIIEDKYDGAIEANRKFQQRIGELTAQPASERLSLIDEAAEALRAPKEPSVGASLLSVVPFVGGPLGAIAATSSRAMGGLRKAIGAAAERTGRAASTALGAAAQGVSAAAPYVPIAATKLLSSISYAPSPPASERRTDSPAPARSGLAAAFKARTDEIKSQTAYDAAGVPRLRPEARAAMAARFDGIRPTDPILADRLETIAARRIEYLSSLIPRRPDLFAIQVGPDRWQPSEATMRSFARSAAAVEYPHDVLDDAAHGAITVEGVDALRAVYPEMLADFTNQVAERLPTLQHTLSPDRQTALSILTGLPVNPAMEPAVLAVFQAQYQYEPEPARAQPQFGSVKDRTKTEMATPAQRREEGTAA